jgi:WD40 repeat protein
MMIINIIQGGGGGLGHDYCINKSLISSNILYSCSEDSTIKVWSLMETEDTKDRIVAPLLITTIKEHKKCVTDILLEDVDGHQILYSASGDKTIKIFDISALLLAPSGVAGSEAVAPSAGSQAYECSSISTLVGHDTSVMRLAASKGKLFSGDYKGQVKVWS